MANLTKNARFSWKTTLAGFAIGLIPVGQGVLEYMQQGGKIDWKNFGMGIGIMALGALAKDADKSGTAATPPITIPPKK